MPLHGEALEAGYGTATAGAIAGGVGGFTSGLIASGGDFDTALTSGATGAAFEFIGGSTYFGRVGRIGAPRVIAHGIVGGTSAELQGREFVPGLFSAAVAKAATGPIDTQFGGNPAVGTVATAVVGGTVSRISGGKFANGAVTASFGYLFNNALSGTAQGEGGAVADGIRALARGFGQVLRKSVYGLALLLRGDTARYGYYYHYTDALGAEGMTVPP